LFGKKKTPKNIKKKMISKSSIQLLRKFGYSLTGESSKFLQSFFKQNDLEEDEFLKEFISILEKRNCNEKSSFPFLCNQINFFFSG
jgi:hypothetical protein